ncbi:hypothetical protein [Roseobacter phage RDJL3]|jgi:hypothetical protein|nr:hypothetical protein [Roseobacter phage RDJL3]
MKSIIALTAGILPLIAYAAPDAKSGAASGGKPTEAADAKPAAEAKDKEPKAPKRGVGTVAMEAILNGATNEEALAAVRKEFPDANTTKASINWYRNKLRKDGTVSTGGAWKGKPVPNAREMAKAAKAAQEGKDADKAKAGDNKPTAGDDPTA